MADHSLGSAYYAVRAAQAASPTPDAAAEGAREHQWQRAQLPEPVRNLVVSALEEGSVLGSWRP